MKSLRDHFFKTLVRCRVFGWACIQTWTAYPLGTLLMAALLFLQGIAPGVALLVVKSIVNHVSAPFAHTAISQVVVSLVLVWGSTLLIEGMLEPVVLLVRTRLNLRMLAHSNLILMEKANSYETLESFESGSLYDEMQLMREEAKYRPLNYCYSVFAAFKELVAVISVLAALCSVQPILSLFVMVCCIPSAASTIWLGRKGWDFSLFRGVTSRKLAWLAGVTLDEKAIKEIRLFELGDYLTGRYNELVKAFSLGPKAQQLRLCLIASILSVLTVGGYVSLLLWLLSNADVLNRGVGAVAISIQAFFIAQQQINQFFQSLGFLSQNLVFFEHLRRFLSRPPKKLKPFATIPAPIAFKEIVFQSVSFHYPDGRAALSNLNLTIKNGETLAAVGANGAGKSTFINLLIGLYEPTEGRILVDGVDLKQIDAFSWRRLISAVFQDFMLYRFSLGENIQLGKLEKPAQHLQEAAIRGGIHTLAIRLPQKYDTLIGREFGGTTLSGGEEQKLAMSRAFFRDAPLLIFDEPTAALDPQSEREVFQRVWQQAKNRTLILVTHRLGSVFMADRILVFKGGTIVEEGDHDSLLHLEGEYASLYRSQASLYQNDEPAHVFGAVL